MCIIVATVMSTVYIVFGRFDRLSFERQMRYIRPAVDLLKAFTHILDVDIAKLLARMKKVSEIHLSSTAKVCCFSVVVAVLVPSSAVSLFVSILRKVFFSLLIGWKGMCLGSLSSMFDAFMKLVQQLTGPLNIPSYLLRSLFYPLTLLCDFMDFFNIEGLYNLLTVTCQGAKAPIELFVDSSVLGAAILFIKSDYNLLWAVTFQEMNRSLVLKLWLELKSLFSINFLVTGMVLVFSSSNPFIIMLRFFLSYVNFGVFFQRDRFTHNISNACIGIEGFQNQELLLVDATSILVWLLIAPMLYSTAEIVCPKGGFTPLTTLFGGTALVAPIISEQGVLLNENHSNSSSNGMSSIQMDFNSAGDTNDRQHDGAQESVYRIEESLLNYEDEVDDEIRIPKVTEDPGGNIERTEDLHRISSHNCNVSTGELVGAKLPDNSRAADVPPPTLQSSNRMVNIGTLRYALSSYVWLACSADVLIVYAIVAYQSRCQKIDSVINLRRLRANQRWDIQTIRQSIVRFQLERLSRRTNRNRFVRVCTPHLVAPSEAKDRIATLIANETDTTKLPPYYRLCLMVQKELCEALQIVYTLRRMRVSTPLSYLLAFSGIGHLFTVVGRHHWLIVMRKYSIFSFACLGIWLNETYKAYDIEDLVKKFTIREPEEATMEFLMLAIASRVILLQALGTTTTLISIIIIAICEAPLFVLSPKLLKKIPPLLYFNSRKVAIDREKAELRGREVEGSGLRLDDGIPVEEWVIKTRALSIFLTESRLIVFLYNLVPLSLTIMVLKGFTISTDTLALLLMAMLPYYVGSTLIPILYIGKRLNLTDEDFRVVFLSWLSRPYAYCRSAAVCIWESTFGRQINHTRSQIVHPLIQEEGGSEPPLASVEREDSEDDISMPSEEITAFSSDSVFNDHESDDMVDDANDIVIDDGNSNSSIEDGSALEPHGNSSQQVSEQQWNGRDNSNAEVSSVMLSEEDAE